MNTGTSVCVNGQLVADAKLMYDLDMGKIGPKLLAIKDIVTAEFARRHKHHSEIMDQFHRRMEETLSAERQEGIIVLCRICCPAAGSRSSVGIMHECLVVERHREHVDNNIRCLPWLPAR